MPSRGDILLARYCFTSRIRESVCLLPYKGSALRGGFGHVLRGIACPTFALGSSACTLGNCCPYHYLFETAPPADGVTFARQTSAPQPFVIEPPLDSKTDYAPGELLVFHVTLVGQAIEYLPYFIVAFEELGRHGIGRGRGRYRLEQVDITEPSRQTVSIYSPLRSLVDVGWHGCTSEDLAVVQPAPRGVTDLTFSFVTPTRVKVSRQLCDLPDFHTLYSALARRLDLLSYFHCGGAWRGHPPEDLELARSVESVSNDLRWMDWRRYSNRQQSEMYLGGFVGTATFRGDFEPFWSRLLLGQYVHLGKGATFGLGQYTLQIKSVSSEENLLAIGENVSS